MLSSTCMASPPCKCDTTFIRCNDMRLSQLPTFTSYTGREDYGHYWSTIYLNLMNNRLTTIPANAFRNLATAKATHINIRLQNNNINIIENDAFNGIENAVTSLMLANNNLSSLPRVLNKLTKLTTLGINSNPISTLDATVMMSIGSSLVSFSLDCSSFNAFPTELSFLNKLQYLSVINPFTILPSNAFRGLESSLTHLDMPYSNLETVPVAICNLVNLTKLTLSSLPRLKVNDSMFEMCNNHKMASVTSLTMIDDKIIKFPAAILSLFPNIESLILNENKLSLLEIPIDMYTAYFKLKELSLTNNFFDRIPESVNLFPSLQELHLQYNQILSIQDYDLFRLRNLTNLGLGMNPLTYISPYAFKHLQSLKKLDLYNTKLTQIPDSVLSLSSLESFFISGAPIICSCAGMAYLSNWNVSSIYVSGRCESGPFLKSYIMNTLPTCP